MPLQKTYGARLPGMRWPASRTCPSPPSLQRGLPLQSISCNSRTLSRGRRDIQPSERQKGRKDTTRTRQPHSRRHIPHLDANLGRRSQPSLIISFAAEINLLIIRKAQRQIIMLP